MTLNGAMRTLATIKVIQALINKIFHSNFWHLATHVALSGFSQPRLSALDILSSETQGVKENPSGPARDTAPSSFPQTPISEPPPLPPPAHPELICGPGEPGVSNFAFTLLLLNRAIRL